MRWRHEKYRLNLPAKIDLKGIPAALTKRASRGRLDPTYKIFIDPQLAPQLDLSAVAIARLG